MLKAEIEKKKRTVVIANDTEALMLDEFDAADVVGINTQDLDILTALRIAVRMRPDSIVIEYLNTSVATTPDDILKFLRICKEV